MDDPLYISYPDKVGFDVEKEEYVISYMLDTDKVQIQVKQALIN